MPEVTKEFTEDFNSFLVELAIDNGFETENETIETRIKAEAFVRALNKGLGSLDIKIAATKDHTFKSIDSDDYVTSFLTPDSIQALKDSQEVTGQFEKKQQEDIGKAAKEARAADLKKEREKKIAVCFHECLSDYGFRKKLQDLDSLLTNSEDFPGEDQSGKPTASAMEIRIKNFPTGTVGDVMRTLRRDSADQPVVRSIQQVKELFAIGVEIGYLVKEDDVTDKKEEIQALIDFFFNAGTLIDGVGEDEVKTQNHSEFCEEMLLDSEFKVGRTVEVAGILGQLINVFYKEKKLNAFSIGKVDGVHSVTFDLDGVEPAVTSALLENLGIALSETSNFTIPLYDLVLSDEGRSSEKEVIITRALANSCEALVSEYCVEDTSDNRRGVIKSQIENFGEILQKTPEDLIKKMNDADQQRVARLRAATTMQLSHVEEKAALEKELKEQETIQASLTAELGEKGPQLLQANEKLEAARAQAVAQAEALASAAAISEARVAELVASLEEQSARAASAQGQVESLQAEKAEVEKTQAQ
jgi:hypothetical protein